MSKKITYHVKEYKCTHCASQVTTSGNGGLTPLTPKFKEINSVLERIHNNRTSRLNKKLIKQTIVKNSFVDFIPHFSERSIL